MRWMMGVGVLALGVSCDDGAGDSGDEEIAGCECLPQNGFFSNYYANQCEVVRECGTFSAFSYAADNVAASRACSDWSPEGPVDDPAEAVAAANEAVLACVLGAVAAQESFQFVHATNAGAIYSCSDEWVVREQGSSVAMTERADLTYEVDVRAYEPADLSACGAMSGSAAFACVTETLRLAPDVGECWYVQGENQM
jgi:hypothetical protein